MSILESKAAASFFLALLIGGCPKRQTVPRVVYVQPPASAGAEPQQAGETSVLPKAASASSVTHTATGSTEALVIEEPPPPPPPEPVTVPALAPATPVVQTRTRHTHPRTEPHEADEQGETADSTAPSPGEIPSLEPQPDPGRGDETPSRLQARQDEIKRRITELQKNSDLSTAEQRTLTDANSFWSQSVAALQDRDLLRARELAQKASLLLAALEKR